MKREVHISSLVVQVRPPDLPSVKRVLGSIPGAEIHAVSPEGKLIVTMETGGTAEISEAIATLDSFEGVLSATLVYHQFESLPGQE